MRLHRLTWLPALLLVFLTLLAPGHSRGDDVIVEQNPAPGNFGTIQAAIDDVHARLIQTPTKSFVIRVRAAANSPYPGAVVIRDPNVPIIGDSTSNTILTGQISATNIGSVGEIRNLTLRNMSVGISLSNSNSATIRNIVFDTVGTGIQLQSSQAIVIVNDTFFNNSTAISNGTGSTLTVTNDIFSNNSTIISNPGLAQISFNDYFPNHTGIATIDAQSIPNTAKPNANPLFVDITNQDFHLQADSPAKGTGNPQYPNSFGGGSDMGAYGGPAADLPTVAAVTGVSSTAAIAGGTATMTVSWSASSDPTVTAYRVYFGTASRSYRGPLGDQTSPKDIGSRSTTTTNLTGIPVQPPTAPGIPQNVRLSPQNQALEVTWDAVAGATVYRVSYGTEAGALTSTLPDVSTTSATITGLTNGTPYFVAVKAVAQSKVFAAVTAVVNPSVAASFGTATTNESAFSAETSQPLAEAVGEASAVASDFPEAVAASPNLKGGGCFIATAAYGFYSAPQVQALRDFRDRYLLTNAPGRAFVAWYYRYGPVGAQFINQHPWLKPPVRLLLLPLVVGALVLTGGSLPAKIALLLLTGLLAGCWWQRRRVRSCRQVLTKVPPLLLMLLVLPSLSQGAEERPDRPHWSLELKGGVMFPDTPNWSKFYGSSYLGEYGGSIAYKVHRMVEVGLGASYLTTSGKGALPLHAATGTPVLTGDVSYELLPLDAFVLARGVFTEDQVLVPYLGGGYTRLFFRQQVAGQPSTDGSVNGFHARGGLQILLDGLERSASHALYQDFGIHHTYLFVEAKYLNARADTNPSGSVNLGGTSALGGFLFEF